MLVVNRFSAADPAELLGHLEQLHGALAARPGFRSGQVGRSTDDPRLWVLVTVWENVGSYRRALAAPDVQWAGVALLGAALDEPGAYEEVEVRSGPADRRARPVEALDLRADRAARVSGRGDD